MTVSEITTIISVTGAVLSPILTIWLNHRYQLKQEAFSQYVTKRTEAISDYLAAMEYVVDGHGECYFKYCGAAYAYTSEKSWDLIDEMTKYVYDRDLDNAHTLFPKLCKQLASETKVSNQKRLIPKLKRLLSFPKHKG